MKKLSLRLNSKEYDLLTGLKNIIEYRSHSKVSFQLILLALIHLKTRSLRLTQKERKQLWYLSSKKYQHDRYIEISKIMPLLNSVNSLTNRVRSGFWNLNQLTRFVNANKGNIDFDLFIKLSSQLDNYSDLMRVSYRDCNYIEQKVGEEFCKM